MSENKKFIFNVLFLCYLTVIMSSSYSTLTFLPITQHKVPFRDTRELKKGPRERLMCKCQKPQKWRRAVNVNHILQSSVKYVSQSLMSTIRSWYQSLVSLIGGINRMCTGSVASFAFAGACSQARLYWLYWLVNWLLDCLSILPICLLEWHLNDEAPHGLTYWESERLAGEVANWLITDWLTRRLTI